MAHLCIRCSVYTSYKLVDPSSLLTSAVCEAIENRFLEGRKEGGGQFFSKYHKGGKWDDTDQTAHLAFY